MHEQNKFNKEIETATKQCGHQQTKTDILKMEILDLKSILTKPKNSKGRFRHRSRTSLVVQWLRLHTYTAADTGLIPGGGTKIFHATRCGQKKRKKEQIGEHCEKVYQVFLVTLTGSL